MCDFLKGTTKKGRSEYKIRRYVSLLSVITLMRKFNWTRSILGLLCALYLGFNSVFCKDTRSSPCLVRIFLFIETEKTILKLTMFRKIGWNVKALCWGHYDGQSCVLGLRQLNDVCLYNISSYFMVKSW